MYFEYTYVLKKMFKDKGYNFPMLLLSNYLWAAYLISVPITAASS